MKKFLKRIGIAVAIILAYILIVRTDYNMGIVGDDRGDGFYNGETTQGYYISYDKERHETGDRVFTMCIKNPLNLVHDSVVLRLDF